MLALVAYNHSTNPGLIGIEIRSMTCFNGFNSADAFISKNNNQQFDVTVLLGATDQAATINPTRPPSGTWHVIGMGWLSPKASLHMENTSAFSGGREVVAKALNLEHVTGKFLCNRTYVWTNGTRDRTPNEILIGRTMTALGSGHHARPERTSVLWKAAQFNGFYQHSLYDFVGSERPSGAAVAYLQVYRNTSQHILAGVNNKAKGANSLLHHLDPRGENIVRGTIKSFIPLLSNLFHGGSDSDIFSFSETPYLTLQGMKHGTFSLSPFFADPRPMTVEGRYSKGSQSSTLLRKINERKSTLHLDNARHKIKAVQYYQEAAKLEGLMDLNVVLSDPEAYSRAIAQRFTTMSVIAGGQSFYAMVGDFSVMLRDFADMREAPVPNDVAVAASRSAGSAANFQQWVAQATQETPAL